MTPLQNRLLEVKQNVLAENPAACLLAVSKTFPVEALLQAAQTGQTDFGENYAQEGCDKVDWFRQNHPELPLVWHFIGPIQSNKTRCIAERFDWVQSIDREKIARRLSEQRPADLPPLNVLIEVNIDGEATKSGVRPDALYDLAQAILGMPRLKLRGLMTIPAPQSDETLARATFRRMRALFDRYRATFSWDTLSMGMSADYRLALQEGATVVRVGSSIFGARHYPQPKH